MFYLLLTCKFVILTNLLSHGEQRGEHLFKIYLILIRVFIWVGVYCASSQQVEEYIELGKRLLASGQLADALTQFHLAIGIDIISTPL